MRYCTDDGWEVEVVTIEFPGRRRYATDPWPGSQYRVTHCGVVVAYVRDIEALSRYVDVSTLRAEDGLIPLACPELMNIRTAGIKLLRISGLRAGYSC